MSLMKQVLLQTRLPLLEARRFRGKIHLKRPAKPHFERQLLIDISKPVFVRKPQNEFARCTEGQFLPWHRQNNLVNPFEKILARECLNWFHNSKVVVFIHMNSIPMIDKSKVFRELRKSDMHLRTYGKKVMSLATEGTHLEAVNKLFVSHQDCIFGFNDNVPKLLRILKKAPQMVIMAGIVHNRLLSKDELLAYSELPNISALQAQLCSILQSAGSSVVSRLTQHQQMLVSQLDQRLEQLKESSGNSASKETKGIDA